MENLEKKTRTGDIGARAEELGYTRIDNTGDAHHFYNKELKAIGVTTWGNIGEIRFIRASNSKYNFEPWD